MGESRLDHNIMAGHASEQPGSGAERAGSVVAGVHCGRWHLFYEQPGSSAEGNRRGAERAGSAWRAGYGASKRGTAAA